jgi:c-di-GMP-binding flagellar brake protein YcgR
MAVLQELASDQVTEIILSACQRGIPMTITTRIDSAWHNLHTRVLGSQDSHLLLAMPPAEEGVAPHEFAPAERIGVNFKLKHHKHIFAATVVGQQRMRAEDGTDIPVLAVVMPTRMQRLQRRAYIRADVPPNRIVRASFWLGGCDSEPAGTSPEHPVYYGTVKNISAGGLQLETDQDSAANLEEGDMVGMRLVFGTSGETIYTDAQFRHIEPRDGKALLGFQFLGLTETPDGRVVLQVISARVAEFQKAGTNNDSFRQN